MLSQCGEWAAMVRVFHRLLSKRPDAIDVIINDGQHNSYWTHKFGDNIFFCKAIWDKPIVQTFERSVNNVWWFRFCFSCWKIKNERQFSIKERKEEKKRFFWCLYFLSKRFQIGVGRLVWCRKRTWSLFFLNFSAFPFILKRFLINYKIVIFKWNSLREAV